jgi:hypothetical protein
MDEKRNKLKEKITNSDVWRSMFRHGYERTGRRYTLQILQNVWLHLHPPRVARHALNFRFTWCMGGITFLMFLVTAVTGVLLMFYYRPTAEYAYTDVQYLEFDIPFGMQLRNIHRWATHGMVTAVIIIIFFALVGFIFWLGLMGDKKKAEAVHAEAPVLSGNED